MTDHTENSDPYRAPVLNAADLVAPTEFSGATAIRHRVVAVSVLMAFILYLDRICLGEIVKTTSFNNDISLSQTEIGNILAAFFFTYALFQVPAGWLSDRFGARQMLTGYILAWSLLTAMTGFMTGMTGLLLARLGCGVAQAGAYPTCGAMIRRWIRLDGRGRASSLVSLGGRLGGTLAPFLTTVLIVWLGGWRATLWLYGAVGILIAGAYWVVVRNRPAEHPDCNKQEQQLVGIPEDDRRPELRDILTMLAACCRSRSLWLNSLSQFCVNIGWAFLINWLPTFLMNSNTVTERSGAVMVSAVLAVGMLGQLIGGWATDRSVRRFGLRRGRILPMCIAHMIAGTAYLSCLGLNSVGAIVVCCAVVSLMTDVANPSVWGFMQDVGGRNTGAIFGWANMWGNLGAACSAMMVPRLMEYGAKDGSGQNLVFIACAGAFFVAGLASLGMDASKRLESTRQS